MNYFTKSILPETCRYQNHLARNSLGLFRCLAPTRNSSSPVNCWMKDCPSYILKTFNDAYIS